MGSPNVITVFVLDDHEVVRRGLRQLIDAEADMKVVGEAATARQAISDIDATIPDVAILDVRLAESCGFDVCRQLGRLVPSVASVMLTSAVDERVLIEADAAGAIALCSKSIRPQDLIDTIRRAAAGADLLDARDVERAVRLVDEGNATHVAGLSEQERRMVELIGLGWSNRQIADDLILAEKTVKNYVSRLLNKLEMSRRTEIAALAGRLAEREAGWRDLTHQPVRLLAS